MVETFRQREVNPSGQAPGYQQVNYDPAAFGSQVGRALQGAGEQFQQTGQLIAQLDAEKKATDATSIYNKAKDDMRPVLFDAEYGVYAQRGGNAMGTGATAAAALDNVKAKYLQTVDDPETKARFEKLWNAESDNVKDKVALHTMGELGTYKVETAKAALTTSMQDAYSNYNDPKAVEKSINDALFAINQNALGLPPEGIAAATAEAKSSIHLAVISRWAGEDPTQALDYYNEHKSSITGKDHVTATAFVAAARDNQRAYQSFNGIINKGGAATNSIFGAMEHAESTGNPNAESAKGASGLMQLMPATAREVAMKQGNGVFLGKSDEQVKALLKSDTSLNRTLGQAYFNEQLHKYGGDTEAALVAYNAGPAAADKFLEVNAGNPPGSRTYDVPGFKGVKTETEAYVNKIASSLGQSSGLKQTPAGFRMTRDNWSLKNFTPDQLMAPTAAGQWVDARAAQGLDNLASTMQSMFPGMKVSVNEAHDFNPAKGTAGKRRGTSDPADNPHVKNSKHIAGNAFDVQVQGWSDPMKAAFISEARKLGFAGFGFYGPNGHLHIDMGNERTWGAVPAWAKDALKTELGKGNLGSAGIPQSQGGTMPQPPAPNGQALPGMAAQSFFGPGAGTSGANAFMDPRKGDLASWMAESEMIADPQERARVQAMLRVHDADLTKRSEIEKAAVQQQAWETVVEQGVAALGPEFLARLEPSFVNSLYAYEANKTSGKMPMDWEVWTNIPTDPKELAAIDPWKYRNSLDNEHYDRLLTMRREAQKAETGAEHDKSLLSNLRTRGQIVDDIILSQNWDKRNSNDAKAIASFNKKLDERITGEQAIADKPLTPTEIQDIADKLLISNTSTWGTELAMDVETPEDFVAASEWDEVQPDDQKVFIQAYERNNGRTPDVETAVELYNKAIVAWLGGKPAPSDEESELLRQRATQYLNRQPTDQEMETFYGRYLLSLLGR